ncbi:MAG: sensor domain-containing diguanylate cyclase, partial [Clostridia bacterium]|nr:sensor domain-containing diguanylate cyclase [Clostridia bacterium]
INFLPLLMGSLFLSVLVGISFNLLSKYVLGKNMVSIDMLINYTSLGILLFMFLVFMLYGNLKNLLLVKSVQEYELSNFRVFTDALHRSTSDLEIYEVLQKYVSQVPGVSHSTLHFLCDKTADSGFWRRISNGKIPLCDMNPRTCPTLRSGKECVVRSIGNDIKCAYQLSEYTHGSYVCFPITISDNIQGILQVYSRSEFSMDQTMISKVRSYVEICKSVTSNRKALTILDKKASTDKLTKLYNRSFLDPYLENQIETANLTDQPLSIILLDIDHFKKVNDTYGHAAGDHVLVVFAEILMKCTRKTDLVARFGGEEFIVVLPSTTIETTYSIADRIRRTTSNTVIPSLDGVSIPKITCSLGIAVYPVHSQDKLELIKAADTALYEAKQSGRNCIKIFNSTHNVSKE